MGYRIVRESGKDSYARSISRTHIIIVPDVRSEGPATLINRAICRSLKTRAFAYEDFAALARMDGSEIEFTYFGPAEEIEQHAEDLLTQVQRAVEFAGMVYGIVDDFARTRVSENLDRLSSRLSALEERLRALELLAASSTGHQLEHAPGGNGHSDNHERRLPAQ